MSITRVRGRDIFNHSGRNYDVSGKPFLRLVNADRKGDRRTFLTYLLNGITHIPNPVTAGSGSRDVILEIDASTKSGRSRLTRIEKLWADKLNFVKQGIVYFVQHDVKYTISRTLRNGTTQDSVREKSLPSGAQPGTLPKAFGSGGHFTSPANMTRAEFAQYMVDEVLFKQFTADSEIRGLTTLSLVAAPVNAVALRDLPMGSVKRLYSSIGNNASGRPGECVQDYILSETAKPAARRLRATRRDIPLMTTTAQVIAWAEREGDVSVYALDPLMKVFEKHVAKEHRRLTLIFVVNNGHCYPIESDFQRRQVIQTDKLDLAKLVFRRVSMKDVTYYESPEDRPAEVNELANYTTICNEPCVLPVCSLDQVAAAVIESTNMQIEQFQYYDSNMTAFVHPVTGKPVIAGRDYKERKALCDEYFKRHKVIEFDWANQSWGELGRMIQENVYSGALPKSMYSPDLKQIFEDYPIGPYRMCEDKRIEDAISVDVARCYTSILMNYKGVWNVHGAFDHVVPYCHKSLESMSPGSYYIKDKFLMGFGTIVVQNGFYDREFVRTVLEREYIAESDLTHVIIADRHLRPNTFAAFATDLTREYRDEAKSTINTYIGCLGALYHRTTTGAVTTDFDTALATAAATTHAQVHKVGDTFIINEITEFMKDGGHFPIYRQIIAASLIKLDDMVHAIATPGTEMELAANIIGYNTDSVKIRGSLTLANTKHKSECAPGEYHIEDTAILSGRSTADLLEETKKDFVMTVHSVEQVEEAAADWARILNSGGLITGMPGCGKSYQLNKMFQSLSKQEQEETAVLTYTNGGSVSLHTIGLECAVTLSSMVFNGDDCDPNASAFSKYKRIILDEFSMLPSYEMGLLQSLKQKTGQVIIAFGDMDQCKAPVDNWISYEKNPLFLNMCGNYVVRMSYKVGFSRYDEKLYNALQQFQIDRDLTHWNCDSAQSWMNICARNETREKINQCLFKRWVKVHNATVVDFGFPICKGLPVRVYWEKNAEHKMVKTQVWTVENVDDKLVLLSFGDLRAELNKTIFKSIFDYAFCVTPQKVQGITIQGHYNIFESERMTADVLYTAMSRGTAYSNVHIVSKRDVPYALPERELSIRIRRSNIELHVGKIYRIQMANGLQYIGQTTDKSILERFAEHKQNPTNAIMAASLTDKSTISLIESFKYISKATINRVEKAYIEAAVMEGIILANKHHVKLKASLPVEPVLEVRPKKVIKIYEDITAHRYEVLLRCANIDAEDKKVRFPWGSDKKAAFSAAEQHVWALQEKYYS